MEWNGKGREGGEKHKGKEERQREEGNRGE